MTHHDDVFDRIDKVAEEYSAWYAGEKALSACHRARQGLLLVRDIIEAARATRAGATAASDTPAPTPSSSAPGSPVGPVGREG